jgi:tripartite-type tricarboxylate transporter receptor subunit TctC
MKLPRRQFLHLTAGAATVPAVSRIARAQTYPARPVRIIVGFAAGGPTDVYARLIGQWLYTPALRAAGAVTNAGKSPSQCSGLTCFCAASLAIS